MKLFFIILAQILMFSIFFIMVALVVSYSNPEVQWYNFLLPIPACVYAANMFEFSVLKKYSYHIGITLLFALTMLISLWVFDTILSGFICSAVITIGTVLITYLVGKSIQDRRKEKNEN